MVHNRTMARPPLGPIAMTETVKFRLTEQELRMLTSLTGGGEVSGTLRQLIHDEYHRTRKGK